MTGYKKTPDIVRVLLALQVDSESGCWLWTKSRDLGGYGHTWIGSKLEGTKRMVRVHRFVFQELRDVTLPRDIVLDHLCRVRHCANPGHLDPVTQQVNAQRGDTGRNTPRASHCRAFPEHVFPQHAYVNPNTGARQCRTCGRRKWRERDAIRRGKVVA